MEITASKQLDHHGVVAGVIDDLGLTQLIDKRLPCDDQCRISQGQAIAGMIVNCLGFTSKPLSLTPHFFSSKALDVLFEQEIEPDAFNRHRLGRCLDAIADYGCDLLFTELAQSICQAEQIDQSFISLDTTSHTLTGDYDQDTDEHEISVTYGYSKANRPDLKQVVQELVVSQDGGIPLMSKSFDGHASDNKIFQSRCRELIDQFKQADSPSYLVADSKLYCSANADNLRKMPFITRIPGTLKPEQATIQQALQNSQWHKLDSENQYYECDCKHLNISQRWLVIHSEPAAKRAREGIIRKAKQEKDNFEKQLKHLRHQAFNCQKDAQRALDQLDHSLKYHRLSQTKVIATPRYQKKGRPKASDKPESMIYTAYAEIEADQSRQEQLIKLKSCYVIGTNISRAELSADQVITAYKNQNASIERGFRFLKDPYFFASSLFIKKPSRLMALLMVMTLALLVYSIAQRRLRHQLETTGEQLVNQINQATNKPTLRWVFQLLEGIHIVYMQQGKLTQKVVTGLTDLKNKIISLFSVNVQSRYWDMDKNNQMALRG